MLDLKHLYRAEVFFGEGARALQQRFESSGLAAEERICLFLGMCGMKVYVLHCIFDKAPIWKTHKKWPKLLV